MTTAEIINCAPWRGAQPRPLTPYEWTIVERAIHDGIVSGGKLYSAATKQLAVALTMAVSKQTACPAWTHSAFGPGPAVATYAYGCLGSWFGGLDPQGQVKALADIGAIGLLCTANVPWISCPRAQQDKLYRRANHSEYAAQQGEIQPGVTPANRCVLPRRFIAYLPLTGQQLLDLGKQLNGGQLPAELQNLVQLGGSLFTGRSFLVGWQLKAGAQLPGFTALTNLQDVLKLVSGMVEDVALVWAPGQGASIRHMVLSGSLDSAALMALLQQIAPTLIDEAFKDLPGFLQKQLPGLLQSLPQGHDLGALLGNLLGQAAGTSTQAQLAADPSTPPNTGLDVVDLPAPAQDPTPPAGLEPHKKGEIPGWIWFSSAAIVGYTSTHFIRRLIKG